MELLKTTGRISSWFKELDLCQRVRDGHSERDSENDSREVMERSNTMVLKRRRRKEREGEPIQWFLMGKMQPLLLCKVVGESFRHIKSQLKSFKQSKYTKNFFPFLQS
jgi:hypothetical protein